VTEGREGRSVRAGEYARGAGFCMLTDGRQPPAPLPQRSKCSCACWRSLCSPPWLCMDANAHEPRPRPQASALPLPRLSPGTRLPGTYSCVVAALPSDACSAAYLVFLTRTDCMPQMKMVQSSITLAFLLAGADAFGTTPECKGHTGDLAMTALLGLPCSKVLPGHVAGKDSCDDENGAAIVTLMQGMSFALKDACPEKCGNPCAHAPTDDVPASLMTAYTQSDCPGAKAAGLCESNMVVNWFCGKSCRSGAQWDECSFPLVHKSARQQIDDDCAAPGFLAAYDYTETEVCEADGVANYLVDSTGLCPGDTSGTGADCYKDKTLFDYGSTQVAQCPEARRRKLTVGTHSGAMKTEGVFTLTASGSK